MSEAKLATGQWKVYKQQLQALHAYRGRAEGDARGAGAAA